MCVCVCWGVAGGRGAFEGVLACNGIGRHLHAIGRCLGCMQNRGLWMFPGSLPICHRNSRGKWNCHRLLAGGKQVLFHFRNAVLPSLGSVYIGVSLKKCPFCPTDPGKSCLGLFFPKVPPHQGVPVSKAWVQVGVSKAACLVLTSGLEPEVFSFCFQAYLLGDKMRLSERWESKWAEPLV